MLSHYFGENELRYVVMSDTKYCKNNWQENDMESIEVIWWLQSLVFWRDLGLLHLDSHLLLHPLQSELLLNKLVIVQATTSII